MRYFCFLLLLSAVAISADLQSEFSDIIDHLPKERLAQIAQDYVPTDSRFRSASSFLQGFNLQRFLQVEEVKNILDYFHDRGFDAKDMIFHYLPQLLGYPYTRDRLRSFRPHQSSPKVSDLIQEKIKTNPEFAKFAEAVEDPKFKTLLYQAMNSKAFHEGSNDNLNIRGFWTRLFKKIIALFDDDE